MLLKFIRDKNRSDPNRNAKESAVLGYVRMKGLEPPLLTEPDPKSGASTNSATPAKISAKLE